MSLLNPRLSASGSALCSIVLLVLPVCSWALLPDNGETPVPVDSLRIKVLDSVSGVSTGIFQIVSKGQTYTLCQSRKYFNTQGANLACRHAGFVGGGFRLDANAVMDYKNLTAQQPVASLPVLTCADTDTILEQCTAGPQLSLGAECPDTELVIFKCFSEGSLRLADGPTANQGRLQILLNGTWYNVCSDYIKGATALAACRMAGYPGDTTERVNASTFDPSKLRYGQPSVYLPYVSCLGDETLMTNCNMGGVKPVAFSTNNKCYTAEADAALVCQVAAQAPVAAPAVQKNAAAPSLVEHAVLTSSVVAAVAAAASLLL